MISLHITLITFFFTSISYADCSTFTDVTALGHYLGATSFDDRKTGGVPISRQLQQISRAKTCHAHPPSSKCAAGRCQLRTAGNIESHAMTNLTHLHSKDEIDAEQRILKLALHQVHWKNITGHRGAKFSSLYYFAKNQVNAKDCVFPGHTYIVYFAPAFFCVAGTLKHCGGMGTSIEHDGTRVSVCMPKAEEGRIPMGPTIFDTIPLSEAKSMRTNPALKVENRALKHHSQKPNGARGFLISHTAMARSLALFVGLTAFLL